MIMMMVVGLSGVEGRKMKVRLGMDGKRGLIETTSIQMSDFSFTAPLYNFSFVENGRSIAK